MWFCDRPRPQQRLALELANLFEIIPLKNLSKFQKSWWVIITKEWINIDHWRLDKFLMLIRFVLNSIFKRLNSEEWEKSIVEDFLTILREGPLSGDKSIPTGIPFHIIDIYIDELEKVLFKDLKNDEESDEEEEDDKIQEKQEIINKTPIGQLITVFQDLSENAPYKTLREKIKDEILNDDRLKNWGVIEIIDKKLKKLNKSNDESESDDEEENDEDEEEESEDEWNGFE
ncbi:Ribosomal RNA processing protein 1 B [Wickerhamomyces ciferrii]|uniref:Ribosomal RNA processing protein 1 B n=1 Tax=Wickerhamomyces ciferrii (strain ATCC 14091 / BCRC 22168 / CBS 111 / JCM 3599 / NBRC 0793 / NRRL Y-1031 F-60-10) TaxID=1206466 RepID=K0KLT2_WICCF|nr:Ribosomal RNA processing protein 1 B [Wickerhamomyces ciferrii]CCH46225.1 Ribosomal RNA processing protein 1 B [Wickerhamomyces ciferrii]